MIKAHGVRCCTKEVVEIILVVGGHRGGNCGDGLILGKLSLVNLVNPAALSFSFSRRRLRQDLQD